MHNVFELSLALVSWRIKEDLTAAIEDEDYDPPTIHNISISEMEEEEEEQQPATASAIVQVWWLFSAI